MEEQLKVIKSHPNNVNCLRASAQQVDIICHHYALLAVECETT